MFVNRFHCFYSNLHTINDQSTSTMCKWITIFCEKKVRLCSSSSLPLSGPSLPLFTPPLTSASLYFYSFLFPLSSSFTSLLLHPPCSLTAGARTLPNMTARSWVQIWACLAPRLANPSDTHPPSTTLELVQRSPRRSLWATKRVVMSRPRWWHYSILFFSRFPFFIPIFINITPSSSFSFHLLPLLHFYLQPTSTHPVNLFVTIIMFVSIIVYINIIIIINIITFLITLSIISIIFIAIIILILIIFLIIFIIIPYFILSPKVRDSRRTFWLLQNKWAARPGVT